MSETKTPPRVLVVEDEAEIAALIAYQLTREGYRVETALTGAAALDALHRDLPDLLVLDRMLPEISGDDVLKALRDNPATQAVPVLILTAKKDQADRIQGLELGGRDPGKSLLERHGALLALHGRTLDLSIGLVVFLEVSTDGRRSCG